MIIIDEVIEKINDEMDGLKCYVNKMLEYKDKGYNDIAKIYSTIIPQEFNHIDSLHTGVVSLIKMKEKDMKDKNIEVPDYMYYMWNKRHDKMIEDLANLKNKYEMAKKDM